MPILPYPTPFQPNVQYPNQISTELGYANDNFNTIETQFNTINTQFNTINTNINNLTQNKANIDLSNIPLTVLRPIASFSNTIDLTNATSDYMLQVGEVARINFNNTATVPLHIATQSGTSYNFYLIPSNTGGTSGGANGTIYLNPNNTTYTNAFAYAYATRDGSGFGGYYYTFSSFKIGAVFSHVWGNIVNFTQYKSITGIISIYGYSSFFPRMEVFATNWWDTTTPWTSLGTVVFPQNSSGTILVQRIL